MSRRDKSLETRIGVKSGPTGGRTGGCRSSGASASSGRLIIIAIIIIIIIIISIIRKAMNEDRFANAPSYSNTVKAIAAFRKGLTDVVTYGHVTVPLVYTQVHGKILSIKKDSNNVARLFTWLCISTLPFHYWGANGYKCTRK